MDAHSIPQLLTVKPRVLAILPGLVPSTLISVVKPLIALFRAGRINVRICLEGYVSNRDIQRANLVVFCRNTDPAYDGLLDCIQQISKPYIYDLDDNLFEIPLDTETGRYHRQFPQLDQLTRYLTSANIIRVYSSTVEQRVNSFNQNVVRVRGSVDFGLIPKEASKHTSSRVKIVYATSRKEDKLAEVFRADLQRVMAEYSDRIEVHFIGHQPSDYPNNQGILYRRFDPDYDRYLKKFSRQDFDIGLAPLYDDIFHRSKTNNKYREYGACRVAGIYSNVNVYSSCVENERTGLLVEKHEGAWYRAIVRLIEDDTLRSGIAKNAYKHVREEYSLENAIEVWWDQIQSVLAQSNRITTPNFLGEHSLDRRAVYARGKEIEVQTPRRLLRIMPGIKRLFYRLTTKHPRETVAKLRLRIPIMRLYIKIRLLTSTLAGFYYRISRRAID